ncbi:MAG: phage tail tape measure protein [Sandaracinaceae bacterium]
MAKGARAKVRVDVQGVQAVKAALAGISNEVKKNQRKQRKENERTNREQREELSEMERAVLKSVRAQVRAFVTGEREKRREQQRTSREQQATARGGGRRAARGSSLGGMMRGAWNASVSTPLGAIGMAGMAAQLASALTGAVTQAVEVAQQRAGSTDLATTINSAQDLELVVNRVVQQRFTGASGPEFRAREQEAQDRILGVYRSTTVDPTQLADGLSRFQNEFSSYDFGMESMEDLARTAVALGIEFNDLVSVLGHGSRQFGLEGDQADEFFAIMVEQAKRGSVTPREFGDSFAREFGTYSVLTQNSGLEGFREFGSLAQTMMSAGGGSNIAATRIRALNSAFSNEDIREKLERRGVSVVDDEGNWRGYAAIFNDIRNSRHFRDEQGRYSAVRVQEVFKDVRARDAVNGIVNRMLVAERTGAENPLEQIAGPNLQSVIDPGRQTLEEGYANVMNTQTYRLRAQSAAPLSRVWARELNQDESIGMAESRSVAMLSGLRAQGRAGEAFADNGGRLVISAYDSLMRTAAPAIEAISGSPVMSAVASGLMGPTAWQTTVQNHQALTSMDRGLSKVSDTSGQKDLARQLQTGAPLPVRVVGEAGPLGARVDQQARGSGGPARR